MEGCTGAARPAPTARRRVRSRTARLDLRTARRETMASGTGRRCEPGRGWRLPPDASSEDCRSGRERRQVRRSRVGGDRGLAPPPGFARRTPLPLPPAAAPLALRRSARRDGRGNPQAKGCALSPRHRGQPQIGRPRGRPYGGRPGGLRTGSPPSPPPRSIRPTVRRLPRSPRLSGPGPHRGRRPTCRRGQPTPAVRQTCDGARIVEGRGGRTPLKSNLSGRKVTGRLPVGDWREGFWRLADGTAQTEAVDMPAVGLARGRGFPLSGAGRDGGEYVAGGWRRATSTGYKEGDRERPPSSRRARQATACARRGRPHGSRRPGWRRPRTRRKAGQARGFLRQSKPWGTMS